MGQAKQRKQEVAQWFAGLAPQEREIARAARAIYANYIQPQRLIQGCYLISFFLNTFLRREFGIETEAVVGWINDGTGVTMASHAWLEFAGKRTDLTLTMTERPDIQPPGSLIILDKVLRRGVASYSYHRERSAEAVVELEELRRQCPPEMIELINNKEEEHLQMKARSLHASLMEAYLDNAPSGRDYASLSKAALAGVP